MLPKRNYDIRSATAREFEIAAHEHAHAFWIYLIISGVIFSIFNWWAIIPACLTIWCAISSIGATRAAGQLRNGTYKIPNPNNGAPDGDARNYNGENNT